MKKITLIFASIFLGALLVACGDKEEATTPAKASQEASDFSTKTNASYDFNEVIEDNENYKFTLVSAEKMDENGQRRMEIYFDFENKLDENVTLSSKDFTMDGKEVEFMTYFFFEEVEAGKTATLSLDVVKFDDYEYPEFTKDFQVEITVNKKESGDEVGKHTIKGEIK